MAEMKAGYKQTDIGVIPEDWDEALIGDLFDFKNGLNKAKEFFGYGTPIVNYMDVFNFSGLRINNVQGKVDVTFQEKQNFSAKKGDVFFTRTSETVEDIGVASVMLDDCNETVFSGFVLRGRPKTKLIEEDYCKYCFSSDEVRKQITSKSTYTTRALTNGRLLSSVILPLPKPEEQKQIAAALSDVDGLIESLSQLIAKKRDMKTAAMQQLLTGKKRLPGFKKKKGQKKTDIGAIPADWDVDFLLNQVRLIHGKAHEKNISINGRYTVVNSKFVSSEGEVKKYSNYNFCPAKIGDVLMVLSDLPNGKALAKCFHVDKDHVYAVNQRVCIYRGNTIDSKYLYYILNRNRYFLSLDDGVTQTHILNNDISKCTFQFPTSKDEQTAIASVLSDMDSEIDALEQRLAKARSLKTGMMQELLTGRTRLIKNNKKQEAA